MKEQHAGIGVCHCRQCRLKKKHCSVSGRRFAKKMINKFRRRQLKGDAVKSNRIGGYWS